MGMFGVGQPVRRREDPRLLTGQGRFVADERIPGTAHAVVLRAPVGHAELARLDTVAARAMPGVLAVLTAADVHAAGLRPIAAVARPTCRPGSSFQERPQPLLADGRVRFTGEPVAFVVAENEAQALDAAEAIEVDYRPLPSVTACDAAAAPEAPQVWPDAPGNMAFSWEGGDAGATEAAFAAAAHKVSLEVVNNRVVLNAMETRNAIGLWDAQAEKYTLITGTQSPNPMRDQLARDVFAIAPEKVRVLVRDVGGGFGGKNSLYPEQALVLLAARQLDRPVQWIGQRHESFTGDFHGRDNAMRGELALDAEGRILAIRLHSFASLGAYTASRGAISPVNGMIMISNGYRIPVYHARVDAIFTNTPPTDPYRGAGRPEVLYLVERLMDAAAHDLGLDRIALRQRNFIPPDAFPYTTPTGLTYDPCDFHALLEEAMARADWRGFEQRRAAAQAAGKLRGIGLSTYIERCGGGGGLGETARLRLDDAGRLSVLIGSMDNGQGHGTAFAQLAHERLGLPLSGIEVIQGDTDQIPTGIGTGGSWSIPLGSGAIDLAAERILEKARRIAAHALETAESDLEFSGGRFRVAGTDLSLGLEEVARLAHDPARLPEGETPGLDEAGRFVPENYTFPYGCHVAELEVDRETGHISLLRYIAVHDFGRALNPLLLAGQVHGGVAQGIGQALLEHVVFDADAQMLSGSLLDYALPRADNLPEIEFVHKDSASLANPFGIKGCGEAGATGSPPAVMNALLDALKPLGVRHLDMPATPEKVWAALRQAP